MSDRLKIIATKMMNNVAQIKRRGSKIVSDLMKGLTYNEGNFDIFDVSLCKDNFEYLILYMYAYILLFQLCFCR